MKFSTVFPARATGKKTFKAGELNNRPGEGGIPI